MTAAPSANSLRAQATRSRRPMFAPSLFNLRAGAVRVRCGDDDVWLACVLAAAGCDENRAPGFGADGAGADAAVHRGRQGAGAAVAVAERAGHAVRAALVGRGVPAGQPAL